MNKYTGIGFLDGLLLLFIGLKLGGIITWGWWWVFAPIWIPLLLVLGVLVVIFIVTVLTGVVSKLF